MSPAVFGGGPVGSVLQVLFAATILTSAAASTQTTILPTARTSLSMAVHKAVPSHFARMHPRFMTPTWSTIGMGIASCAFFLLFTLIDVNLLNALVESLGVMIAFYYGLTGFACAWFYRRTLRASIRNLVFRGVFPLVGGLFLFVVLGYGLVQYASPDWLTDDSGRPVTIFGLGATAVVGVLGLLIGFVPMALWWRRGREFFRGRVIARSAYVEGQPVRDELRVTD
jgi:amino acid transporter